MGVQTDLILDNGRSYDAILASTQPSMDFSGVYAKGLDHLNLLSLAAIIAGAEPPDFDDPDDAISGFDMIASSDDHYVGVWRPPPETIANLKTLIERDIPDVAARWAATPFLECMDWEEDLTIEFLNDLCKMLRQRDAAGQDILMWVST